MTTKQRDQLQHALDAVDDALRGLGQFWVDLPEAELDDIKESLLAADGYIREALRLPARLMVGTRSSQAD